MKEFIINDFLSVKLERYSTVVYVKGKRFDQCKYLLLEIPILRKSSYDRIESIDMAADNLDGSLEPIHGRNTIIPPEVEF